jgi:1-acyl-sn-glycerol-3-phosphate acyltransferase
VVITSRPDQEAARDTGLPPRDLDFIRDALPWLDRYVSYFRAEVHGLDRMPPVGRPFLVVGNHSGGWFAPDLPVLMTRWWRERGVEEDVYALFHSAFLKLPGVGPAMARAGGVEAGQGIAERILRGNGVVAVFPGGDHDVFRPWSERNRIDFDNRTGWIRLALRTGVPVVPMVSVGAHETLVVLSRGDRIAGLLGLNRMRVKIWPVVAGVPWGISLGWLPTFPLPAKITVELMKPFDWTHFGPDDADDDALVERLYDEAVESMQGTLDRLAADRRLPVLG